MSRRIVFSRPRPSCTTAFGNVANATESFESQALDVQDRFRALTRAFLRLDQRVHLCRVHLGRDPSCKRLRREDLKPFWPMADTAEV